MAATDDGVQHVDHPLLTPRYIERRLYQLELATTARSQHTLVCLPTGLGKTTVSLLVTAERLHEHDGKVLFLAPTKPLVDQHAEFYRHALSLPDESIVVFTGEVRPDDRSALWDTASVVVATPQVVENDLIGNRISLEPVVHLTFDECHRATGEYSYNFIADRYHAEAVNPLVTGMSASPGNSKEAILEVCANLGLDEVAVMTDEDADVGKYTHDTEVEWETVELPDEIIEIRDALNDVIRDRLTRLKELGVSRTTQPDVSQRELNEMRGRLQALIESDKSEGYTGMSIHAEVMKIKRAVEVVETQSVEALRRYFERQRNAARSSGASKASQRFVSEPTIRTTIRKAAAFDGTHPKFSRARIRIAETLGINGGRRVIVFTESRDTAEVLTEFLGHHFTVQRFVGQGNREGSDGMSQKEQREVLSSFRDGEFEVLVSTSVAEEGLDVPEVDLVLFFEPVPTAIRAIQRRGRTGRQAKGRVVVLMAKDTRDEAYFWISRRREKKMETELRELKRVAGEVELELQADQGRLDRFKQRTTGNGRDTDDRTEEDTPGEGVPSDDIDGVAIGVDDDELPQDMTIGSETESRPSHKRADDQAGLMDFSAGVGHGTDEYHRPGDEGDDAGVLASAGGEEAVEIVADQRELDAAIARDLSSRDDIEIRLETLAIGDYVCSDRVVVERKSVSDFLDTLLDGDRSLFKQARDMARHYTRPVVIIEGDGLYTERNVHPNAIRGALASLAVDFGVSVLQTEDEGDTADLLAVIAGREQQITNREVRVHGEKSTKTRAEQQEYVVSSIGDIGPVTARALLEQFRSVEAIMTASEAELQETPGVGKITASRIREVVGSTYEPM